MLAPKTFAAEAAKSKDKQTEQSKTQGDAIKKPNKTVKYRKSKTVDFGNQTIEGNIQRPKAALITGSESGNDSGILRLREDFMDKFAADNGEEIK